MTDVISIRDGVPEVAGRSLPWAERVHVEDEGSWFVRRFRLVFENGWTLSVTYGSGSYSPNHRVGFGGEDELCEEVTSAEVAVWLCGGDMIEWQGADDTVRGWVAAQDVLALIDSMMSWPSELPKGAVATLTGLVPA